MWQRRASPWAQGMSVVMVGGGEIPLSSPRWTVPFPAAIPEPPTYHSVKQLSSDAAAPLRLLKLSSVSKLIPRRQLFPDAPESAAREREKRGVIWSFRGAKAGSIGSPIQRSNLSKHSARSTIPCTSRVTPPPKEEERRGDPLPTVAST